MTLRVAFIDDHDIVRSGFVQLLSLEADIQVVGEFSSAAQARAGLPGLEAEICICDISMPDGSGLDLLADIPSGIRVVMLSMHDNPALVEMALDRGASGFLQALQAGRSDHRGAHRRRRRRLPDAGNRPAAGAGEGRSVDPPRARNRAIAGAGPGGARDRRRLGAVAEDGACASRQSVRQAGYQQ